MILTSPRVSYAVAKDGVFLQIGGISRRFRVPTSAFVLQAVWASALMLTEAFQQLLTYLVSTPWIFCGLTLQGSSSPLPHTSAFRLSGPCLFFGRTRARAKT